jgi:NIMA (never in mitosis gene a)-related kinase
MAHTSRSHWCHLQALLGLSYIHSRKAIHRDIKSLNLFLDAADNIKVRGHGAICALHDANTAALLNMPMQ